MNLAATFRRKDLSGVEQSDRIEGIADALHQIEIDFGEKQRHQMVLFHAHAVLAGDRSAHFDAEGNDISGSGHRVVNCCWSRASKRMIGCRLPSPA